MKRLVLVLGGIFLAVMTMGSSSVHALNLGVGITISDGVSATGSWYGDHEDQEVEPNCATGQIWDLEGFFMNGNKLYMVGGFDFANGVQDPYRSGENYHYRSGDIFVGKFGITKYGPDVSGSGGGYATLLNTNFLYNYVFDMDFNAKTYTLYQLNDSSLVGVYFGQNDQANPWQYVSGGTFVKSGSFDYITGQSDGNLTLSDGSGAGLLGDNHNVVGIDLTGTPMTDQDWLYHFTYQCGNDNLMGNGSTAHAPEPATMFLLGSGLIGLAAAGRKKFRK